MLGYNMPHGVGDLQLTLTFNPETSVFQAYCLTAYVTLPDP